jgi:hypothetical protein
MRYVGQADTGAGVLFIGKGVIVGADIGNMRYKGTYVESGGRIKGTVVMSAPQGGMLVTGAAMPAGSTIQVTADWPPDFANGQAQQIIVAGRPVQVTFDKIGDVP